MINVMLNSQLKFLFRSMAILNGSVRIQDQDQPL